MPHHATAHRPHPFDVDTAVTPRLPGLVDVQLSDRWNAVGGQPNGGYLTAICARAMATELPLHPDPFVVSATFLRPADPGPATVHVDLARVGRRLATAGARLVQDDREVVRATATFGDLDGASGRTLVLGAPPELPPVEDCQDLLAGGSLPGVTIADRLEYRPAVRPGWLSGQPAAEPTSQLWVRIRDREVLDPFALLLLTDGCAPAVMEIGEPGSATVELTAHVRARPAPGWLRARISTRFVQDGYHEEDVELWDETGRLVAQSRQFAVLPRRAG